MLLPYHLEVLHLAIALKANLQELYLVSLDVALVSKEISPNVESLVGALGVSGERREPPIMFIFKNGNGIEEMGHRIRLLWPSMNAGFIAKLGLVSRGRQAAIMIFFHFACNIAGPMQL